MPPKPTRPYLVSLSPPLKKLTLTMCISYNGGPFLLVPSQYYLVVNTVLRTITVGPQFTTCVPIISLRDPPSMGCLLHITWFSSKSKATKKGYDRLIILKIISGIGDIGTPQSEQASRFPQHNILVQIQKRVC